LAHVFHIQISKNHVPRWFTEGLAEYETLIARPEWTREQDPALFEAVRSKRLPALPSMSRAFTRAEQPGDVATAYYASSRILTWMVERFGRDKVTALMGGWGQGQRTGALFSSVLGKTADEVDQDFKRQVHGDLARYRSQFVPVQRVKPPKLAKAALDKAPADAVLMTDLARSLLHANQSERASKLLDSALKANPELSDARYLKAELLASSGDPKQAKQLTDGLLKSGQDGYFTRLLLGRIELLLKDDKRAMAAFEAAHQHDPTQAEPLGLAYKLARKANDHAKEIELLKKLTLLEQHSGALYARLLHLLVEAGRHGEALPVGEAGIWADLSSFGVHYWYAEALRRAGKPREALFELESAVLCDSRPEQEQKARKSLAEAYRRSGQPAKALEQERLLQKLRAGATNGH
jgi:predicted Zn-dependent protease